MEVAFLYSTVGSKVTSLSRFMNLLMSALHF